MTYEYLCPTCDTRFDVIKSYKEMNQAEHCKGCGTMSIRQFVPTRIHLSGTSVQNAEWNPGLGAVVRNKAHREELAKRKGLTEIGNDYKSSDNYQKHFETEREKKRDARYEQAFQEALQGDGRTDK